MVTVRVQAQGAKSAAVGRLPPVLGGGLPLLGHALEFARDPVGVLRRGRERFGNVWSFPLAGSMVTVFTGPEASQAVYQAPEDVLSPREAYRFTVPIFGKGVAYDVSPEAMSEQLGWVFPALREERLQAYARIMADETEAYCDRWGESGTVDLYDAMNELTVNIASHCLIGVEFRRRLSSEFAALYHQLEAGINLLAILQPYLPLPSFRRRDRARQRMGQLISAIVAERRAHGVEGEDFLQTLMATRYADGTPLSDETITGILLTLIFAGQHTSAVLASWAGILLLQHPTHLATVLEEQRAVFGAGQEVTLEALRSLPVLERCIREAERLHPPLIMLMRKVLRDFAYDGYRVPAGGLAMVSAAVSHRIPEVFALPERYDPDRFGPGRGEDKRALYAMQGFGGGRHRCIGATFAYQQIKAIWSVLLRRFELQLAQPEYRPNYASFVVGPRRPCPVRYRRRSEPLLAGPAHSGDGGA